MLTLEQLLCSTLCFAQEQLDTSSCELAARLIKALKALLLQPLGYQQTF